MLVTTFLSSLDRQGLILYQAVSNLNKLEEKKAFANFVGKGENAGNQHCLLFSQRFPFFQGKINFIKPQLICRLQVLLIRTRVQFCRMAMADEMADEKKKDLVRIESVCRR